MRHFFFSLVCITLCAGLFGCKKFEAFQTDPNRTTAATPDLLLTTIEQAAFNEVSTGAALASRHLVFTDGVSNMQYYGWTRGSFNDYNNLRQVVRMEQEASRTGKKIYLALAKFFRGYFGLRLTLMFGDIPYSNALKGEEGMYTAVYDTQEDIFLQVLNDLKEANTILASSEETIQGDIVYRGEKLKWQKLINSFSLRVLMMLSGKENNTKLNPRQRFGEIVNNPTQYPTFTSNSDNAQLTFVDIQGNRYPYFNNNELQTAYYMEESFVRLLQESKDPRLFSFAAKAPKWAALPNTDFNAYGGVGGSATITENTSKVVAGEASKINPRFYSSAVNEPSIAVSFSELQFILAEAAVRGWIAGDAVTFYKNGIKASMAFYGVDESGINNYLNNAESQLRAGSEIKMIITQKYIASFMNAGLLPFYEQRRTGFPVFDVSGGGVLNNGKIPVRWMYPESELQVNRLQVTEAIQRQFPQGDNINALMWLLQ